MLKGNHETETNHECGGAFFQLKGAGIQKNKRILIESEQLKKQLFETKVEKLSFMHVVCSCKISAVHDFFC